ncbi:SDR family NAD(P)-dependent oxidoreductase [Paraburkholderia caribensis]|uniref:SDR family NAD(P)-dependent oxidoreductase n=1 Tax=Paraburkholderia caribensis TaxID=75105 RepID=UPI0007216059|nr:SDR family NAD(P)-dependent oxidoreductase [Paraburkholderia caribensis]ALP67341.1 3-oxoacyl-ACP reductase [Paraburkholderia caribensis]AUT57061.1 SDR family NAD(P)-dependent oxidoreductase [Paraburkholderia caribensis]MDR6381069.1 3-oxoacyl-[acyl-carrier protein] reductase [Paraburkholderia caribensis]
MNAPLDLRRASYDFAGAVAVVTGGLRGIGAAIAGRLAECGASVAVWDRDTQASFTDSPRIACFPVDIADIASVERAAQATLERFGGVNVLVNNAGYAGPTMPLDEYDPAEWSRIVDVNLKGTFNVCRQLVPTLRRARDARIVNIASLAGKEGTPNASAYSAAKAGVLALTKSLGKELARGSVLVNAIAPAAVRTTLLEQMSHAHVQTMIDKSPMKRLGEPDEVAELALWLCSSSCTFSTGAVFDLSGGRATC